MRAFFMTELDNCFAAGSCFRAPQLIHRENSTTEGRRGVVNIENMKIPVSLFSGKIFVKFLDLSRFGQ